VFVRFEEGAPVGYFVTNVDGTGVRQLTPPGMILDDSGFGGSWSPSGDDILFVARESEDHHKAIWIIKADAGSPQQLPIILPGGGRLDKAAEYGCYSPDWSPDGERIVFTRAEPFGSTESIWIVNADGTGLVQVTDGEDDNPDWETPPSTT
jgi:Tol biopolymer transport system component